MGRDSSGNYSLPYADVVTGTTISSTWANGTLADLKVEMTNSLDRTGKGGMLYQWRGVDGTAAAPAYSFSSETGSGLYLAGANDVRMVMVASALQKWTPTAVTIYPATTIDDTLTVTGAATFNGNVSVEGNTTLGNAVGDTTTVKGPMTAESTISTTTLTTTAGAESVLTKPGSADHSYVGFYARTATPTTRSGYVGYGGAGFTALALGNLLTGGDINLIPGTGGKVAASGNLELTGANPASTTAFADTVTPTNIVKAWAKLTTSGNAVAPTVNDGFNVASTSVASTTITVTFAQAFANANYAVYLASTNANLLLFVSAQATGSVSIQASEVLNGGSVGSFNFQTNIRTIFVQCVGAQ